MEEEAVRRSRSRRSRARRISASAAASAPVDYEKDPLALFSWGALAMFTLDLRAFYASPSGRTAAQLAVKYFPIGAEANFSASRDLDRVTGGIYSMQGADALAVFDRTIRRSEKSINSRKTERKRTRGNRRRAAVCESNALHGRGFWFHDRDAASRSRGNKEDDQARARSTCAIRRRPARSTTRRSGCPTRSRPWARRACPRGRHENRSASRK